MDPIVVSSSLSRPWRGQWVLTGAVSSRLSNSGGVLCLVRNMGGHRGYSCCTYHLGNPVFQSQSGRYPLLWLPSRTPPLFPASRSPDPLTTWPLPAGPLPVPVVRLQTVV